MNAFKTGFAVALLAAGTAHAQLVEPAPSTLQARPSPETVAFAKIPPPFEPAYMLDEGEHAFAKLFDGFGTDPRLVAGINLNRYLALEAGYAERQDRGFHRTGRHSIVDQYSALDETGALGVHGFHSYAALKATAPISGDLSVYGKLGVAHSERRGRDELGFAYSERRGVDALGRKQNENTDTGLYTGLGAQYKLNEKAAVSVEGKKFGHSGEKWGKDSNGNRVDAKMGFGF